MSWHFHYFLDRFHLQLQLQHRVLHYIGPLERVSTAACPHTRPLPTPIQILLLSLLLVVVIWIMTNIDLKKSFKLYRMYGVI
jgi:hypothetical protein